MRRWLCTVAYDGTDFDGWQSQPSNNAVQDHIQARLTTLLKSPTPIHGSGRTDAGVHARAQVFHVDLDWNHGNAALKKALNTGLPPTIRVIHCQQLQEGSEGHARFSAIGKRYTYHLALGDVSPFETRFIHAIHSQHFDLEKARAATELFRGTQDFTPFAARREAGVPIPNGVRTIHKIEWEKGSANRLTFSVEGNGFLYKMVRSIVGTLIQAGLGRISPEQIESIFAGKERTHKVATTPAQGLFLDEVFYPRDLK